MSDFEATWLQQLDDFADRFRTVFRRRDQARWAAVYLQGLLLPAGERKTIGMMARRVVLPPDLVVEDVAQALQNFINQSPWDELGVARRSREILAEAGVDADGVFVLDELAFVKQGQHSVGVQRQYSSALGRKTNCQTAVVLYHVGPAGAFPLSLRLYLPRGWLQAPVRLETAGVPVEYRRPQTKSAVALDLLDEARAEGWTTGAVVAAAGYGGDRAFRDALTSRGYIYSTEAAPELVPGPDEHLWPADGDAPLLLSNRPAEMGSAARWQARRAAQDVGRVLLNDLGLDHFEGRSWRGFHHHACLVLLAYAFRARVVERPVSCAAAFA